MKSMLKALGKTDRCHVAVVLFARLECLRRNAPDPSRQRLGPRPPNRDVRVRTVRNSRPPFVKRSGSVDQTSCLWSSRSLSLFYSFSSFFLFFILTFFRNGQGQNPPPPNGHARIFLNAEIYRRSLRRKIKFLYSMSTHPRNTMSDQIHSVEFDLHLHAKVMVMKSNYSLYFSVINSS